MPMLKSTRRTLADFGVLLVCMLLTGLFMALAQQPTQAHAMHLYPPRTDLADVGKVGLRWRDGVFKRVTADNVTTLDAHAVRQILSVGTINATNYSIATAHNAIYCVVNGNAQNVTLPNPNLLEDGDVITIIDAKGQAASNTIAVNSTNTTSAANVNGAASVNISTAYGQRVYTQQGGRWLAR